MTIARSRRVPPSYQSVLNRRRKRRPGTFWQSDPTAAQSDPSKFEEVIATYGSEGYLSMSLDVNRNAMYKLGILNAIQSGDATRWLEIGPGGHLCLTKMVLKGSDDSTVVGIEANSKAVKSASLMARQEGLTKRIRLITGLSTNQEVIRLAKANGPYHALVQELLGFFAGSEGAAAVLHDLYVRLASPKPLIQVPRQAVTLFCPVLVTDGHVTQVLRDVYHCPSFSLILKFPISAAANATGGTGPEWLKAGLVEHLNFCDPKSLPVKRTYTTSFQSPTDAYVNALVCWIWCEVSEKGARNRTPTTGYPYGASGLPPLSSTSATFSSRVDDDSCFASNWRNVCIPLPKTLTVPAGHQLNVEVVSDLRTCTPSYQFTVTLQGEMVSQTTITNFYPTFTRVK